MIIKLYDKKIISQKYKSIKKLGYKIRGFYIRKINDETFISCEDYILKELYIWKLNNEKIE